MKNIKIKTTAIVVIMTTLFGATTMFANTPNVEKIRKTIEQQITYPDFAKEKLLKGDVTLTFGIDNEGNIVVHSAKSSVPELAEYVKSNLSSLKFGNLELEKNKKYRIVITFDLL